MIDEKQTRSERSGVEGLTPVNTETEPYDATRDPRTGRPPTPLEAQRLAREHERERLESENEGAPPAERQMPSAADFSHEDIEANAPPVPAWQEPARMVSPKADEDEKAAIDALVQEGVTREYAEELVEIHGTNWETLKAAAFEEDNS
jgi:hypothetical protein